MLNLSSEFSHSSCSLNPRLENSIIYAFHLLQIFCFGLGDCMKFFYQVSDLRNSLDVINSATEQAIILSVLLSAVQALEWNEINNLHYDILSDQEFLQVEKGHADNSFIGKCFKPGNRKG